jgi:hypothetical protein
VDLRLLFRQRSYIYGIQHDPCLHNMHMPFGAIMELLTGMLHIRSMLAGGLFHEVSTVSLRC